MWVVKMTIFDDKAQIWSRDTSFWSKLNVDYEIKGLARKGYSWDHRATKIYFSKIFQNDVIETGSHQTPLILQGTTSVVYHEVIQTKNKIVRVSLKSTYAPSSTNSILIFIGLKRIRISLSQVQSDVKYFFDSADCLRY